MHNKKEVIKNFLKKIMRKRKKQDRVEHTNPYKIPIYVARKAIQYNFTINIICSFTAYTKYIDTKLSCNYWLATYVEIFNLCVHPYIVSFLFGIVISKSSLNFSNVFISCFLLVLYCNVKMTQTRNCFIYQIVWFLKWKEMLLELTQATNH